MPWQSILVAAILSFASIAVQSKSPYQCTSFVVPLNISVNTTKLKVQTPQGGRQLTGLIQETFSLTSNASMELVGGKVPITASYNIWSQLCVPTSFSNGGILEFAIHGINLDHFYWELGGTGSDYNYVEAAVAAGHAIFTFDRLGTGMSSTPDGIRDVQTSTQIAIAAELVTILRTGIQGHTFGRIVAIGHSYGSYLLAGLAAAHGTIVDDMVLTGFSTFANSIPTVFAGLGLGIASELNSSIFGCLSSSYMATASVINIQQIFFFYPEFSQSSLDFTEYHKGVFTIGELLTISEALAVTAPAYTGSVFVVSGDKDFIVCGGNCFQTINGSANLLEPAQTMFPSASNFSTNIPAKTGHLINGHFSAPDTFQLILEWIGEQA